MTEGITLEISLVTTLMDVQKHALRHNLLNASGIRIEQRSTKYMCFCLCHARLLINDIAFSA